MRPILATVVWVLAAPLAAAQVTLYSTDFTDLIGWTVTTSCTPGYEWAADATPASHSAGPWVSAPASLNFNDGADVGGTNSHGGSFITCGSVASDPVDLSLAAGDVRLRFMASWDFEPSCAYDILTLRILSAASGFAVFATCLDTGAWSVPWTAFEFPLDRAWGAVRIEFLFHTNDAVENGGTGAFIDDLSIVDVLPIYTVFCAGDGSATPCPCGNTGAAGTGCVNSTGVGAVLVASGTTSIAAADLVLVGSEMRPNQFGTFLQGTNALNGGNGVVFGAGLRCAGGSLIRLQQDLSDAGGNANTSIDVALKGNVAAGDTRFYQLWYRDPVNGPCSSTFNLTNGIVITWVP